MPTVTIHVPGPLRACCDGATPLAGRSGKGGTSWRRLVSGLPKKQSDFTILRDGMDIDQLKTPPRYFGTTTGQVWIGREGVEKRDCLFDMVPPACDVKVAVA